MHFWRARPIFALLFAALPAAAQDFSRTLYPVLERVQCRSCHNDNGVASTTRLQFPREKAPPGEINRFGLRLRRFVNAADPARSPLIEKPTGRVIHGGGERITRGSADEAALRAWVEHLAKLPEDTGGALAAASGPTRLALRRLTHSQYDHTVRDLLGDETRPASQFPKEDFVHGFTNQAEAQSVSPLQAEAYGRAAARLARNAFRGGDSRGLVPCAPSPACAARFVREFGRRAFRRPLTAAEAARYEALIASQKDFLAGAQLVVETMLQSPNFLFLLAPDDFGTASRYSYFLWDTMPDAELMRAAEAGELRTRAGIEKQVRRMLEDARAKDALDEFLSQWLRFDRLRTAIRDRRLYPEFTSELVSSMTEETRLLFRYLVWEDGNFMDFFTAPYTHLLPETARVYGMPAPKQNGERTAFPKESGRAGILGQATFLALTSKPADTSPTERGIFVREHFLCQSVPPPPPGLNASLPPVTDEKPLSARDRLAIHLSSPVCANCHQLVDPIGFGFENYDAIGRFREKEAVTIYPTADEIKNRIKTKPTEYKLDIHPQGMVRGIADSDFTKPVELGVKLAAEPACQRCVVKQLFRYATGRAEEPEDERLVSEIHGRFAKSGFRFRELILALATSEAFTGQGARRMDPTPR
ncbi:MAG: DUF1592 domain-containing protein [Acidobacteria bacterium]|nr:DUF1592 domain-containing protein [Acidobacteriota bacterium]